MLSLILRQILSHKLAFFLLFAVWFCGGYLLYLYHNPLFAYLSYWFASPSLPQRQEPAIAYQYLKRAQLYLQDTSVNLEIMEKSCSLVPKQYRGKESEFHPDWLERVRAWKLEPISDTSQEEGQVGSAANFPDYWQKNYLVVLQSLKSTANAMQFAYEIPLPQGESQRPVVIPRFFERYARAICKPHLAILAWGDYVSFQEKRATRQLMKTSKPNKPLNFLKANPLYIEALYGYLGYPIPRQSWTDTACNHKQASLLCMDTPQTVSTYHKLLKVEAKSRRPRLHLQLAQAYLHKIKQTTKIDQEETKLAMQHLIAASRLYSLEAEARMIMVQIWIRQKNYARALTELRHLYLLRKSPGFDKKEFAMLAKKTLIGVGRPRDGDCFPQMNNNLLYSNQEYCKKLRL